MNLKRYRLGLIIAPVLTLLCSCAVGAEGPSESAAGASESGGDGQGADGKGSGSSAGQGDEDELTTGDTTSPTSSGGGTGSGISCSGELPVIVRDFTTTNPDFEPGNYVDDRNIVGPELGPDNKPVYAGNPKTTTTHGKESFDQWFRDTPGINQNIPLVLKLTQGANGVYTYDNQEFFPIDGQGLGNEGNNHNFHFTTEVHTEFTYKGGEVFKFSGDDDLFGYINRKLVINLGGIHQAEEATVNLDQMASQLGLVVGNSYTLDLFGAERHVTQSHYRIETTIDCFVLPPPPK
jgi:fibro-slime domain-containing protein